MLPLTADPTRHHKLSFNVSASSSRGPVVDFIGDLPFFGYGISRVSEVSHALEQLEATYPHGYP